ncbi:hypothetical protein N7450_001975 [Penicillium hetheringtonii]|uniref:Uncharacterized protein n=1 Tax=Penicillium hetheringtonii TaxID=911720 RepID=A0AAD6E521_9EURO|nr:hypothetical protein N7450_001975 [Penicillium hetheringtonii]
MVFAQLDQKPDDDCWFNEVDEVDDHFLCKDAVWRQMLFQQPPQSLFGIFHADSLHLDDELTYTVFKWPDLLRLGVIFDKILRESESKSKNATLPTIALHSSTGTTEIFTFSSPNEQVSTNGGTSPRKYNVHRFTSESRGTSQNYLATDRDTIVS